MSPSPFSAYTAIYGPAKCALAALSAILKKGEQASNAASLPSARLAEDMHPLTFQVYAVSHAVDRLVTRTTKAAPREALFADSMKTFEDMQRAIADALALLASASEDVVNANADGTVPLPTEEGGPMENYPIHMVMSNYALPNLYFHVSIAYAILRKEGVELGKSDYITPFNEMLAASEAS